MTIKDRVTTIMTSQHNWDDDEHTPATVEKMIAMAYYMGREMATREISDQYNALIAAQRERANACRYSKMANAIIGDQDYIYSDDYRGEMTSTFGNDTADI